MSTAFHILIGHQNVVDQRLVLNNMRTHPTHYYLESIGLVAYMKTHPKLVSLNAKCLHANQILPLS